MTISEMNKILNSKVKPTIFGEEHFIDNTMVNLIYKQGNVAIENHIADGIYKIIKHELPMPGIIVDKEKLKKWLFLCAKLENIEKSDLIDMATKKRLADLSYENERLKREYAEISGWYQGMEEVLRKQLKTNTHQVCEKIREDIKRKLKGQQYNFSEYCKGKEFAFLEIQDILDQIEKGENI